MNSIPLGLCFLSFKVTAEYRAKSIYSQKFWVHLQALLFSSCLIGQLSVWECQSLPLCKEDSNTDLEGC